MKKAKYLLVGGGAAGSTVTSQLLRAGVKGEEIVLLEKLPYISYSSCSLPYYIEGQLEWKNLFTGVEKRFISQKVNLETNTQVKEIDVREKKVIFQKEGVLKKLFYENLVIASGATPNIPFKVENSANIFTLKTPSDAKSIKEYLHKYSPSVIAIVGGGMIGIEMLYSFLQYSPQKIYLLESKSLLNGADDTLMEVVRLLWKKNTQIELLEKTQVKEIYKSSLRSSTLVTNRGEINAELILIATGFSPEISFLKYSANDLEVNFDFSTSYPQVWAIGDCVKVPDKLNLRKKVYFPSGQLANRAGRICATNLLGKKEFYRGTLKNIFLWTKDFSYGATGLREADFNPQIHRQFFYKSQTKAGALGETFPVLIRILTDLRGKILGASLLGKGEISKRVDIFSLFIDNNYTLEQAYQTELTYQPMVSPVWDPILASIYSAYRRF
jgi:NADPH-dependent 2,4-dienoyl-CoA reductase/sulfur reductase-like enzyme